MKKPVPTDKEIIIDQNKIIISKTDTRGFITYTNDYFMEISGYTKEELVGTNHNIIRHPDMPSLIFKMLWTNIKAGKPFRAIIKNLTKDGSFYWVLVDIEAHYDPITNNIDYYTGYRKAVAVNAVDTISKLYNQLKEKEVAGGMDSSRVFLEDYFGVNGTTYEDYMGSLAPDIKDDEKGKGLFGNLKIFGKK